MCQRSSACGTCQHGQSPWHTKAKHTAARAELVAHLRSIVSITVDESPTMRVGLADWAHLTVSAEAALTRY